ncbi:hypothetical protein [Dysosmobacter welbionis]
MNYKQVQRYIRLTELVPDLQKMVDEKKLAFTLAVEISVHQAVIVGGKSLFALSYYAPAKTHPHVDMSRIGFSGCS